MLNIEYIENLDESFYKLIDDEFNKYATKNNIKCNYTPFNFVAREDNIVIGIITGHSYYKEVHIGDLIILEEYRNKHIGSKLIEKVEDYFRCRGFENINLTTYNFQAPEFYKKCGYRFFQPVFVYHIGLYPHGGKHSTEKGSYKNANNAKVRNQGN